MTLHPRKETIIAVPVPDIAENSSVLIDTQNIMDNGISGNCVTILRNQTLYVTLINPTEN